MIKKVLFTTSLLGIATTLFAQQGDGPQLIIRADDMGAFHSTNMACMESALNGIVQSVEVMPVASWYPEAVKMLQANPSIDVGLHLVFTSEWENVKWRPLTVCKGLTDEHGYFFPMMKPHAAYPGLSIMENQHLWDLEMIEREARAQIEMTLRDLPQLSHITGHMGSTAFTPEVFELMQRLSKEYHLPIVSSKETNVPYAPFQFITYNGSSRTPEEKMDSFIRTIKELPDKGNFIFVDHPTLPSAEVESVFHIGYEQVAYDREGVWRLFMDEKVKQAIAERHIRLINYNELTKSLPRGKASSKLDKAFSDYLNAIRISKQEIHSVMILQHGKVVKEQWFAGHTHRTPHALHSVSKTFTATAIGFAIQEKKLKLNDKVVSFFPKQLEGLELTDEQREMEVRHLLTMSSGHDIDPTQQVKSEYDSCRIRGFFSIPITHKPGTFFVYNNQCSYLLSAIIQQVTGEDLLSYLYPRLLRPLGITGASWRKSPEGFCLGSGGLQLKTEDLAKMGQLFLQKGQWNGEQLISKEWIEEASSKHIASLPAGVRREDLTIKPNDSDWLQGYGYQMWRCRHHAFRADGAHGQFILVFPEKDAVIAVTAHTDDMQAEINLIWKHLWKAL